MLRSWTSALPVMGQGASETGRLDQVERRHRRFDVFLAAGLACPTHGMRGVQQLACSVRNVSLGGAAVHVGPAFESVPDMVILDIPCQSGAMITVNCQVVGRKAGMLHLRFLKDLGEREIAAILAAGT